jgi:hypothetical protein
MKDIYELDLEWQYTMLSYHVSALLKDIDEGGVFLAGKHIGALRRRMETIDRLRASQTSSKSFAQGGLEDDGDSVTINTWPSSQICMECEHGAFIMSEEFEASSYACNKGIQLGPCDGGCAMFEKKLAEIE